MDIKAYIMQKARGAKEGAVMLRKAPSGQKNKALIKMADSLRERADFIIGENKKDIHNASEKGLTDAMIERLTLNEKRIDEMAQGLIEVSQMNDPVGEIIRMWKRPNGMKVGKMRAPIGVVCMIYESRPNVTADATGLCLKAGNSVFLRGGSEALNSNKAIVSVLRDAVKSEGLHEAIITFVDNPDRSAVIEILKLEGLIDLVIPRGGEGLIRTVTENSRIPVLKHYKGVCHLFVDRDADIEMAIKICFNSKIQRPGTCNALETLLIDEEIVESFLPRMIRALEDAGVKIRGCQKTLRFCPNCEAVNNDDFYNEYLSLILNVKVLSGIDEAIEHINRYGSAHTDAIVTNNHKKIMQFLNEVDSSAVIVNASTRLNDGGQFGLGAEIGISTDKIHARGPMGIEELTNTKFIVLGDGQLRE